MKIVRENVFEPRTRKAIEKLRKEGLVKEDGSTSFPDPHFVYKQMAIPPIANGALYYAAYHQGVTPQIIPVALR